MIQQPTLWRISWLALLGKLLISMSIGVLLFVAWTLWGTNFVEHREQQALEIEYEAEPILAKPNIGGEIVLEPPEDFAPPVGTPIFRMRIPRMELNKIIVEGVAPPQLDVAPGHYPACRKGVNKDLCTPWDSAFPGEDGRVVISGHRTTHGAPFWDLNELREGDEIITETKWGTFTYEVTHEAIVDDSSRKIVVPGDHAQLVLTACHPRFSAAQRYIVFADLVRSVAP